MNKWTHSFCDNCYAEAEPDRIPSRIRSADLDACCKCGKMHQSGIYYRHDPAKLACQGKHD